MDQQQVKLEKDEDKQEMERELKDLVSAAGKSRKKHKNQAKLLKKGRTKAFPMSILWCSIYVLKL